MPHVNQATAAVNNKAFQSLAAQRSNPNLENVELLMALDAQNLVGAGFDNSVRRAAEAVGAEFLFNIPAPSSMPFQRAALVRLPEGNNQIVLVSLSEDGVTMDAQSERPDTAHLFRLGEAWLAVANQFRKLS
jgi:hypothetical protein